MSGAVWIGILSLPVLLHCAWCIWLLLLCILRLPKKKKRGGKRSKYISKGLTNKYMADHNCASIDNSIVQTAACMTPEAGRFNNVYA